MTTYSRSDLRAVHLLALVLFCVGILLALIAVFRILRPKGGADALALCIWAVSALSLGTALRLKVRRLARNRGEEPGDHDGAASRAR